MHENIGIIPPPLEPMKIEATPGSEARSAGNPIKLFLLHSRNVGLGLVLLVVVLLLVLLLLLTWQVLLLLLLLLLVMMVVVVMMMMLPSLLVTTLTTAAAPMLLLLLALAVLLRRRRKRVAPHFVARQRRLVPRVGQIEPLRRQAQRNFHARHVPAARDRVQPLLDGLVHVDHLHGAQRVDLVQRHLPLEYFRDRYGLVNGPAHRFQDDGRRPV